MNEYRLYWIDMPEQRAHVCPYCGYALLWPLPIPFEKTNSTDVLSQECPGCGQVADLVGYGLVDMKQVQCLLNCLTTELQIAKCSTRMQAQWHYVRRTVSDLLLAIYDGCGKWFHK